MRAPQTVLAFDYGTRRIGVAIGTTVTGTARPLAIVDAVPRAASFVRIGELIAQWQPDRLVVGRPATSDGAMHASAARCERFARQLQGRFGLPVDTVDERYSTLEAQAINRAGDRAGDEDDAVAAAVILEQYLDQLRHA